MKMSASSDWGNRPRAREEVSGSSVVSILLSALVAFCIVMSLSGVLVMWAVHILHDAGAVDWTLSFRQGQLLSVCFFFLLVMWNYIRYNTENAPTHRG